MTLLFCLLVLGILALWLFSSHNREQGDNETTPADRERHRQDASSHVYYYREGTLVHESEYCNGCAQNRAEELRREGYQLDEVILGRHHSGEL